MRENEGKEHISFDGKVVRGSKHGNKDALQLMTAIVVDNGLIIYQKETSTKTNEIPVMQSMLCIAKRKLVSWYAKVKVIMYYK